MTGPDADRMAQQMIAILAAIRASVPSLSALADADDPRHAALVGALTQNLDHAARELTRLGVLGPRTPRSGSEEQRLDEDALMHGCAGALGAAVQCYGDLVRHISDRLAQAEEAGIDFQAFKLALLVRELGQASAAAGFGDVTR